MSQENQLFPRLRPVEAVPVEHEGEQMVLVQDPTGLADGPLVVSPAGFFIMTFFDGRHSLEQVQAAFRTQFGQSVPLDRLAEMAAHLDKAHYLDSPDFADFYAEQVDQYRAAPVRQSRDAESFGADGQGLGPMIDEMLGRCTVRPRRQGPERLVGLIAPHLDYARGSPCYLTAYQALAANGPLERAIILGTNHFGRGTSVVATDKDFETPFGTTRTDRAFLADLEQACGVDLCENDFDHLREHSIELQVLILQHLFGPANFEIVPILCPDACGPTGTAPIDGNGVELRVFAEALGRLAAERGGSTVVIAGADLSHFGRRFGDDRELDAPFLTEIQDKDREALDALVSGRADLFLDTIRGRSNETRICSSGSMFTLTTALPGARAELLGYHQTVDRETGTAVSCSAMAMWREE